MTKRCVVFNPALRDRVRVTVAAVTALAGELYFFLMQRSALEVCRFGGLPASAADVLLPPTYKAAWIFAWGKWVPIALLVWHDAWLVGLALWAVGFVLSALVPVPHGHFFPMFYASLETPELAGEPDLKAAMKRCLEAAERARGVRQE